MRTRTLQAVALGGLLILAGVLLLAQTYIDLSAWIWFALVLLAGLVALAFYLADRSNQAMFITAYVLLAVAFLLALIMMNLLRDEGVAVYVLTVIALPFMVVWFRNRSQWWALIPAYVLLTLALMIGLLGSGILDDLLVPAYVMFAIAIPFFAVYAWNRARWWALIPAGVMTAIALFFLVTEEALQWLIPVFLILVGIWLLSRSVARRRSPDVAEDEPTDRLPEWDGPADDEPR
jgi:hypothetical protein